MSTSLLDTPWLWPFLASALALVAVFSASLFRAAQADADAERSRGPRPPHPSARPGTALALGVGVPLTVIALYAALGAPRALDPLALGVDLDGRSVRVEDSVDALAKHLNAQPDDLEGWLMLARSRKVLGQNAEAAQAYARADALDRQALRRDPDRLADWIEARILADQHRFDPQTLALLAEAMALAPEHPGVLMMRGLAALDRGDRDAARRAFTTLRDQQAPGSPDQAALERALSGLGRGEDPRVRRAPDAGGGVGSTTPTPPSR